MTQAITVVVLFLAVLVAGCLFGVAAGYTLSWWRWRNFDLMEWRAGRRSHSKDTAS